MRTLFAFGLAGSLALAVYRFELRRVRASLLEKHGELADFFFGFLPAAAVAFLVWHALSAAVPLDVLKVEFTVSAVGAALALGLLYSGDLGEHLPLPLAQGLLTVGIPLLPISAALLVAYTAAPLAPA